MYVQHTLFIGKSARDTNKNGVDPNAHLSTKGVGRSCARRFLLSVPLHPLHRRRDFGRGLLFYRDSRMRFTLPDMQEPHRGQLQQPSFVRAHDIFVRSSPEM